MYMLKENLLLSFCIKISRKFILLSVSISIVNFSVDVRLLKEMKTSCTWVYQKVPRLDL
jgi:hypothetical protein